MQLADLAKGPGHYPGTPLPGQIGNAAIAGHRTTHGAPFCHVDELGARRPDPDPDVRGHVHVRRVQDSRSRSTRPTTASSRTPPTPSSRSRAATRRYSARQRIVIKAKLAAEVERQAARRRRRASTARRCCRRREAQLATGLQGESNSDVPSVLWGIIVAGRRLPVVVGVPPLAPPAHVGDRRHPVPDGAVPVLRVPGTRASPTGTDRAMRPASTIALEVRSACASRRTRPSPLLQVRRSAKARRLSSAGDLGRGRVGRQPLRLGHEIERPLVAAHRERSRRRDLARRSRAPPPARRRRATARSRAAAPRPTSTVRPASKKSRAAPWPDEHRQTPDVARAEMHAELPDRDRESGGRARRRAGRTRPRAACPAPIAGPLIAAMTGAG